MEDTEICPGCHHGVSEVDLLQSERAAIGSQIHEFKGIRFHNKESKAGEGEKAGQGDWVQGEKPMAG